MSEASLLDKIRQEMRSALKSGEKRKLETLRMVVAEAQKDEIERQRPLNDDEVLALIKRGIKTRAESISQFEKGGRQDLVEKEKEQTEILKIYLPQQLSVEALKSAVQEVIATLKVSSKKDMGLVMKTVMGKYGSQVDGKEVQGIVASLLKA